MGVRHKETVVDWNSHHATVQEREHDALGNLRILPLKAQASAREEVASNGLVQLRQGFKRRNKPPVRQAFREGAKQVRGGAYAVPCALDGIGQIIRIDCGQHEELEHWAEL